MTRPWLFSIFLSGVLCAAQDGVAPTYAVQGTIVNAQTNQPIGRAEVILNNEHAVLTSAEGRFEFDQIPMGDYQVSIEKPGYISIGYAMGASFGRRLASRPRPGRRIRVGPKMPELTFRLVPCGSIRGQVSLSTSDPADRIRVIAYQRVLRNGLTRWEMAGSATTNSEGVFHLGDVVPGNYILLTEPSPDRPAGLRGAVTWGYPSSYYPGVTDSAAAGVLAIAMGQNVEADFALTRQAFYPLTAQVLAVDPGSPGGFRILDTSGRTTNLRAGYDARDQTVHANVPNGAWVLRAQGGRDRLFGQTAFQVANRPVNTAITILPIPKLHVTIRREFTSSPETPQEPAGMARAGPGVNLQLEDMALFGRGGIMRMEYEPNRDPFSETTRGTIEAMPGRYWVEVVNAWSSYVSSITSGQTDLAGNPLVITSNNSNAPIEVVLRNDAGTIKAQFSAQAGDAPRIVSSFQVGEVPQIYVYAIPLFPTAAMVAATSWASDGEVTLPNLAPGSYRVIACDSEQEIDFHTPEGLAAWDGKGRVVNVDPGATATVQLDVLHAELP